MGMNILERIAATKRQEVEAMKEVIAPEEMIGMCEKVTRPVLSMKERILSRSGIIAEHKRRSPSKGEINPMSEVANIAKAYYHGGASAMSVLTDTPYFGGSLTDLAVARRSAPALPLLRKEFIVDEYQLYQARVFGADAVLLIAAMLPAGELRELNDKAHSLGLETLVETHNIKEMESVPEDADMVGINNRDLTTFHTDLSHSARLIESLPPGIVRIAESGIRSAEDVVKLRDIGFNGFLIGEALMSALHPGLTLLRYVEYVSTYRKS